MPLWSNTDVNASKPKYLNTSDRNNNNANVYGVDSVQASVANTANQKFHGAHQGWVKIIPEYTDSSGQVRRKSETLVVMGATITGNANITCSGNVAITNNSANLVGTSTRFTIELKVGDVINVNNSIKVVSSILSSNLLTVNSAFSGNTSNLKVYVGDENWFPHS